MHTFILVASEDHPPSNKDLQSYAEVTRRTMPCLGVEIAEGSTLLPECNAGWVWLAPACAKERPLISEYVDDEFATIAFGETFGDFKANSARTILKAWKAGEAYRVSRTEGSFGAAIVHRASGRIVLVNDGVGRRALRYHVEGGTLTASPHDLSFVATGRCPTSIDYASASSIVSAGWSLGGRSLLSDVHSCRGTEYVRWHRGQLRVHPLPSILQAENRIDAEDVAGISEQRERMIEAMRAYARLFIHDDAPARTTLTAGQDSRTALSLLLAEVRPRSIKASCDGESNSLDVRTARRVAKLHGVDFSSAPLSVATPEEFLAHADLLAFAMNGDTNGKRAAHPLPAFDCSPEDVGAGHGAGVTCGSYQGSPYTRQANLATEDAFEILKNKALSAKLPWTDQDFISGLEKRSDEVIGYYTTLSDNGHDILDLFRLHDRVAVWAAMVERFTWKERHWSPFLSLRFLELAGAMPAPIGDHTRVRIECIRRFAPESYWVIANGKTLLPLERHGQVAGALRFLNRKWQALLLKGKRFRPDQLSRDSDQLRSSAFAGSLSQVMREVITSEGSFAFELFGCAGTERLLREHITGEKNHLQTLGALVVMERWRTLINRAACEKKARS